VRQSLQDALFAAYPAIFRQRELPLTDSAMGRGIECCDGWFALLDGLCEVLAAHALKTGHPPIEAAQVKEKLGGLRFYAPSNCTFCKGAIDLACTFSYHVCEETGRPGTMMVRSRQVQTLARDIGEATGYQVNSTGSGGVANGVNAPDYSGIPKGWHDIADAMMFVFSAEGGGPRLELWEEGGVLSAAPLATPDSRLSGVIACASALSARTDRATGAMRIPAEMSAGDVEATDD